MRRLLLLAVLGGLAAFPACRPTRGAPKALTVRGGPLLRGVFTELEAAFATAHPEVELRTDFSCPPCVLTTKIQEGIDLDAFVSAGDVELKMLEEGGVLDAATRQPIGKAQLVLAVPEGNPAGVHSLGDLNRSVVRRIALGDPEATSPGYYARQAFEEMGLWKEIQGKLQVTKTGCEAFKSVAIARADAAVLFEFCLEEEPGKPQVVEKIPERLHDPIVLSVTLAPKAPREAGATLVAFLRSPAAQDILRKHGIEPVGPPVSRGQWDGGASNARGSAHP